MFHVSLKTTHNASFQWTFVLVDSQNQPVSQEGATLRAWIKRSLKDSSYTELSTDNGKIIIDEDEPHKITLTIPANTLQPTSKLDGGAQIDVPYVFDILRINSTDDRPLIMKGTVSVAKGVTE